MIAAVMIALALPIAVVILAVRGGVPKEREALPPEASAPLQKALEGIAGKVLPTEIPASGDLKLEFLADHPKDEGQRMAEFTKKLDGVAILSGNPEEESEQRLLIQIPRGRMEEFLKTFKPADERTSVASNPPEESAARILLEVVIRKNPPP